MAKIDLLKQYLTESPDDPFLHYALAKEFEKEGEYQSALAKYRYLVSHHADYVGTYYHLGKLLEQVGEVENAKLVYQDGMGVATEAGDAHSHSELEGALQMIL